MTTSSRHRMADRGAVVESPHRLDHVVVVGASLAGLTAARALREGGHAGPVTLIGLETHPPYDRPPLSKDFLLPDASPDLLDLGSTAGLQLTELYGQRASALDPRRRVVRMEDGTVVEFDGLVIATGVGARRWSGRVPSSGVHTLRTWDDAHALRASLAPGRRRVVVVGGGFIGSETAATLCVLGHHVTLIVPEPAPMYRAIGDEAARFVEQLHYDAGVSVVTDTRVLELVGDAHVRGVLLDSGDELEAEIVVLALGDEHHTQWLTGSGVLVDRGVVTDEHARVLDAAGTPIPHIVAAGDVTRFPHPDVEETISIGHWSNAVEQARVAVQTLLDPDRPTNYRPVASFWSHQYGVRLRAVGLPAYADSVEVHEFDPQGRKLEVTYHRNGHMIGALTANRAARIVGHRDTLATRLSSELPLRGAEGLLSTR